MSEFPRALTVNSGIIHLTTQGPNSMGCMPLVGGGGGNAAWASANLALYIPFRISERFTFSSFLIDVGTASGNIDIGVYTSDGTKIISTGSTAASANIQRVTCTSTKLEPGLYYLALAADNTTFAPQSFTLTATAKTGLLRATGVCQQASAFPLPATATFAAAAGASIPICGISNRSFA